MSIVGIISAIGGREPWQDQALCRQVDADIFYPEHTGPARAAKQVCAMCPVINECLEYALRNHEKHGIWGGLSERERHRIRRPRPAAGERHGNRTAYRAGCRCRACKAFMTEGNRRRYRDRAGGAA